MYSGRFLQAKLALQTEVGKLREGRTFLVRTRKVKYYLEELMDKADIWENEG